MLEDAWTVVGDFIQETQENVHGALDCSHPVLQFFQNRLEELYTTEELIGVIHPNDDDVTAYSLPNSAIGISRGLLKLIDTYEELDAVIRHERRHLEENHFEELQDIGHSRLAEYKADLGQLVEEGANPVGMILLMQKLHDRAKGKAEGIVHGSSFDRLVNTYEGLQLVDVANLSISTTPLPKEIKDWANETVAKGVQLEQLIETDTRGLGQRESFAREATLHTALHTLDILSTRTSQKIIPSNKTYSRTGMRDGNRQRIASLLSRTVTTHLSKRYHEHEALFLSALAVETISDFPISIMNSYGERMLGAVALEAAEELDPETVARLVSADTMVPAGLAIARVTPRFDYLIEVGEQLVAQGHFGSGKSFNQEAYLDWCAKVTRNISTVAPLVDATSRIGNPLAQHGVLELITDEQKEQYADLALDRGIEIGTTKGFQKLYQFFLNNRTHENSYDAASTITQEVKATPGNAEALEARIAEYLEHEPIDEVMRSWRHTVSDPTLFPEQEHEDPDGKLTRFRSTIDKEFLEAIIHSVEHKPRAITYITSLAAILRETPGAADAEGKYRYIMDPLTEIPEVVKQVWTLQSTHWKDALLDAKHYLETLRLHRDTTSDTLDELFGTVLDGLMSYSTIDSLKSATDCAEGLSWVRRHSSDKAVDTYTAPPVCSLVYWLGEQELDPVQLFNTTKSILNDGVSERLQGFALDRVFTQNFNEGFDFITSQGAGSFRSGKRVEQWIDQKATTRTELRKIKDYLTSQLDFQCHATTNGLEIFSLFGQSLTLTTPRTARTLLTHGLRSRITDLPLRNYIRTTLKMSNDNVDLDFLLNGIYGAGQVKRYALYRTLLTNQKTGVLHNQTERITLANELFSNLVQQPETATERVWTDTLKKIVTTVFRESPPQALYSILQPLLATHAFRPPKTSKIPLPLLVNSTLEQSYKDRTPAVLQAARNYLLTGEPDHEQSLRDILVDEQVARQSLEEHELTELTELFKITDKKSFISEYNTILDEEMEELYTEAIKASRITSHETHDALLRGTTEEIKNEITGFQNSRKLILEYVKLGEEAEDYRSKSDVPFDQNVDDYQPSTKKEKDAYLHSATIRIVGPQETQSPHKLKPLEFIVETAKSFGAPGVRFCQLLGQYLDIPAEMEGEFNKVYDATPGQTKVSAVMTLEREWPRIEEELITLGKPAGAGSLVVGYDSQTTTNGREIIKVLNPNAEFHTRESFKVMSDILEVLAKSDPRFETGNILLADIEEWILRDIAFTGFLEQDRVFRYLHHGTASGDYSIIVPQSYGPENKYFKREEFIEGENLTQRTTLLDQGHNLQAVVATIARNYVTQIMQGQVHSDVHPGNFRVTANNGVAILDRNLYLNLDNSDKMLITSLSSSSSPHDKAQNIGTYLATQGHHNPALIGQVEQVLDAYRGTDGIAQSMKVMREGGVELPLRVTLMAKNIMALDNMSRKEGFSGVQEALFYQ
jgi:predicted unusual protein kinase regulating ubiquinone biosynthesis (AarF/ABC1/UbiB family)